MIIVLEVAYDRRQDLQFRREEMTALCDELFVIQKLILEEISGIDPCYAFQAAMRVHNYYRPESKVTSDECNGTPIFKD